MGIEKTLVNKTYEQVIHNYNEFYERKHHKGYT